MKRLDISSPHAQCYKRHSLWNFSMQCNRFTLNVIYYYLLHIHILIQNEIQKKDYVQVKNKSTYLWDTAHWVDQFICLFLYVYPKQKRPMYWSTHWAHLIIMLTPPHILMILSTTLAASKIGQKNENYECNSYSKCLDTQFFVTNHWWKVEIILWYETEF